MAEELVRAVEELLIYKRAFHGSSIPTEKITEGLVKRREDLLKRCAQEFREQNESLCRMLCGEDDHTEFCQIRRNLIAEIENV